MREPTYPGAVPPERFADFLASRRRSASRSGLRTYATLDDLVDRRRSQNPRLSREWLRFFAFNGARETPSGWVWKADLRAARGFGPWKPEWIGPGWRGLRAPMLAVIGSELDTWGPLPESIIGPRQVGFASSWCAIGAPSCAMTPSAVSSSCSQAGG